MWYLWATAKLLASKSEKWCIHVEKCWHVTHKVRHVPMQKLYTLQKSRKMTHHLFVIWRTRQQMQESDLIFARKMTEAATSAAIKAENAGKMAHHMFVKWRRQQKQQMQEKLLVCKMTSGYKSSKWRKMTPFVRKMTEAPTKMAHGASYGMYLINKCHTVARK